MNEMIKKLFGDKFSRANNIAKSVRSLQRVPEKERPRIVKKAVFNIYVIGSIIILISLWLYFFGNEVSSIPIGNHLEGETFRSRKANLYLVLPYKPNIPLIHSILSCKLFVYICKFLYLYTIILADIYA